MLTEELKDHPISLASLSARGFLKHEEKEFGENYWASRAEFRQEYLA